MKFKITVEETNSICPQWQLRIENIETKVQICIGHCELEDKEGLDRLYETRAKLDFVLND